MQSGVCRELNICMQNDVQIVKSLIWKVHMKPMTGCLYDFKGE